MSNKKNNKKSDKNVLYIAIFSIILIIALIAIFATKCKKDDNNSNSQGTTNKAPAVAINSEFGDQMATIEAKINIPSRKVDFSESIDEIMKSENKKDDTLELDEDYEPAKSSDGYTYLMYKFNNVNAPEFFGTQIATSDEDAMLTYVFFNDILTEIRVQYGSVGLDAFDNIVEEITSSYGQPTYSRSYSNGSQESWWKTEKITLDIIYQDAKVILYYRQNK